MDVRSRKSVTGNLQKRTQSLLLSCFFLSCIQAQKPITPSNDISTLPFQQNQSVQKTGQINSEHCSNGIDDDGNRLVDLKDPYCYFNNARPDTCMPTKILWATFVSRLYWLDLETNADRVINFPLGQFYDDITWTPSGKLLGVERFTGVVNEINAVTGQTQFFSNVPGYYYSNGMTSDAQGMLYLSSFKLNRECNVVKLNPATGQVSVIANLTALNLQSAGDLTFFEGFLYVSCTQYKLVKIDLSTGNTQVITYSGSGYDAAMGLVNLGDGYLYISSSDQLFRLNPVTWVAAFYMTYPTYGFVFGLCGYSEFCSSPSCRSKLKISTQSNLPFCSNTGVSLKGQGTGINGLSGYKWTLPNGQVKTTDTLTAFQQGKYILRYHTVPDTCGITDSISLTITQYPSFSLGSDTILCPSKVLTLQALNASGITSYLWQDGTTQPQLQTSQPGTYWVEGTNVCGRQRDSIIVLPDTLQKVDVGNDTAICANVIIPLKNTFSKRVSVDYVWSTGATVENIFVQRAGTYWLQATNGCGVVTDTISIVMKDSCSCNPLFAEIDIGDNKELCSYDTLLLFNSEHKEGYRYVWQNGSSGKSFVVKTPGIYWLNVSTHCNTIRDTIIITPRITNCECLAYLPNAFTPNNDGKNDKFRTLSTCNLVGEIRIFNRAGVLVFHSANLQNAWNGTYKGALQPNDVYVYYLSYHFLNYPGKFSKKGTVALIK